jgi:deazaflavin-dependent oxidoreductase (nitroreductase family)
MTSAEPHSMRLDELADESFCYLTTTGRVTGKSHTIEIWFALRGVIAYMLAGGRDHSDWVRNIVNHPEVTLRIADREFQGRGRVIEAPNEDRIARELLVAKYQSRYRGDLIGWRERALPVAVDLITEGSDRRT